MNYLIGENILEKNLLSLRDPAVIISLFVAFLLGFYLLLTSTSDPIPAIYWRYDAKRILQFVTLFLLFLVPVINGRVRKEFGILIFKIPYWMKLTFMGVFFWGTLSVLVNAQSWMHGLNSFSEVALLSVLVVGVFIVAACRRIGGRYFDQIAIGLVALTALTVGIQELIGVVAAQNAGVDFNFRISLMHFSWPRFYNQVQSWTVPVLVALPVLFNRYKTIPFILAIVLGLQWYVMVMGAARGSVVSLSAAILFAMIFFPHIRKQLFLWQVTGVVIGLLIYVVVLFSFEADYFQNDLGSLTDSVPNHMEHQTDSTEDEDDKPGATSSFFSQSLGRPIAHTSGRSWIWRLTLDDALHHPVLGIGPMNYVCTSSKPIGHPHNFPLQLAAEWGIPIGFTVLLLFLFLIWKGTFYIRAESLSRTYDTILAELLLVGVIAAACHACLSGVAVMPASQITGLLLCGILLGLWPNTRSNTAPAVWRFVHIPGLILCLFLLFLGAFELSTMQDRELKLPPEAAMFPRIWQDAKVCSLYIEQKEVKN